MLAEFVRSQVVNVGFAVADELDRPFVQLVEIIRRIAQAFPLETQPADILERGKTNYVCGLC